MDFNLKNYRIVKLKKYFKKNDFFFLFHSSKLDSIKWVETEQTLKKLKLNYYKPFNGTTLETLKNSIYQNFSPIIGGFILFINPSYKITEHDHEKITKSLKSSFVLVSVKLNKTIYLPSQLKGLKDLSYKKNMFHLYKSLDKHLKTTYVLTNKKKVSK